MALNWIDPTQHVPNKNSFYTVEAEKKIFPKLLDKLLLYKQTVKVNAI
jgi:hypothetical protein